MLPWPLKQPIHNTSWCEKTTYIIFQLLICIHNSDPPYVRSYLHQVILFYNLSFRNVPSIIFNIDNIIEFQLCLQFSSIFSEEVTAQGLFQSNIFLDYYSVVDRLILLCFVEILSTSSVVLCCENVSLFYLFVYTKILTTSLLLCLLFL